MKLFKQLVKGKKGKEKNKNDENPERQISSASNGIPEFVEEDDGNNWDSDLSDHSRSFTPYVGNQQRDSSFRYTDEERAMIITDDALVTQAPTTAAAVKRSSKTSRNSRTSKDRSDSPIVTAEPILDDHLPAAPQGHSPRPPRAPAHRAGIARSSPSIASIGNDSFYNFEQPAAANANINNDTINNSSSMYFPPSPLSAPSEPSPREGEGGFDLGYPTEDPALLQQQQQQLPNGFLSPQELMEVNRLMTLGYNYEAALTMMGIDLSERSMGGDGMGGGGLGASSSFHHQNNQSQIFLPPHNMPPHPGYNDPNMMMMMNEGGVPGGSYYPPAPGYPGAAPYQSYYGGNPYGTYPPPYDGGMMMPPPYPNQYQQYYGHPQQQPRGPASFYYQENEEEVQRALRLSMEEEQRRRTAVSINAFFSLYFF
jgi:hypothetical protein